eukprot:scaffold67481_cov57-Phaeocystis_antarctica.AAC.2
MSNAVNAYEARRAIAGELCRATRTPIGAAGGGVLAADGNMGVPYSYPYSQSLPQSQAHAHAPRHNYVRLQPHVRLQLYVRLQMQHELGTTLLCTSCVTSSATRQHSHGDASPKGPKRARSTSPNLHACDPQRESTDEQGLLSAVAAAAPVRAFGLRSPVSGRALWPHHVSSAVHAAIACSCVSTEPCCAATYSK